MAHYAFIACAVVFVILLGACSDSTGDDASMKSYDELATELESNRAALPDRELSIDAAQRQLPDPNSWDKPTQPEFLLKSDSLDRAREVLKNADPNTLTNEQQKVLSELDQSIRRSIWMEMDSINPEFPYAYTDIHPVRAAWVLTADAHAGIDINGMTGYFFNDAYEAPLAAHAFETLGMPQRGRAIRDAIEAWPDDQPLDTYPLPLDERTSRLVSESENDFYNSGSAPFEARPFFALQHPEIFFDLSSQ